MFSQPTLQSVSLKSYQVNLALDRLKTGVDNIRYDVHLSPDFQKSVRYITMTLISVHSKCEGIIQNTSDDLEKYKKQFRHSCKELMEEALNTSKRLNEPQVNTLSVISVIKFLQSEIQEQFNVFFERLTNIIRSYEVSDRQDEALILKKKTFLISENKNRILINVSKKLFGYFKEIQTNDLNPMRRINFGDGIILPDNFFENKMLFTEDPTDDYFTLKEYNLLMGHRLEDPDKYENIISTTRELLIDIYDKDADNHEIDEENGEGVNYYDEINGWLKHPDNIDTLLNFFQSRFRLQKNKRQNSSQEFSQLKQSASEQKRRLNFIYKHFKKKGLMPKIIAAYEIQPIYLDYCPPLVPHLVAQFLISGQARKNAHNRLKQLKKIYGRKFNIKPLQKKRTYFKGLWQKNRKGYLIRFLKDLSVFHRDFENHAMIQKAVDQLNIIDDEKLIQLSRINDTLYDFLLPHERVTEEKPIINHVILKADVRGSTDITHKMLKRSLNPASYFSLNFFNPITDVLSNYGAKKVFVEGDAIILSVFERENDPSNWYSIARTCGLAVEILDIVKSCNMRNRKHRLPPIELGIGITFFNNRPAFLYDGNQRIMISSAINIADRLSSCSKQIKHRIAGTGRPFPLYVFQSLSDEDMSKTADDLFLRFNVNGIELSRDGFRKLKKEIDLKKICIDIGQSKNKKNTCFYTGLFPLVNGEYRRLVIRVDKILKIDPNTFKVLGQTSQTYYEVCTHPKIIQYINKYIKKADRK